MSLFERVRNLFMDLSRDEILRSAIQHEQASAHSQEASRRNHTANGRLREATRRLKSSAAFADFESAVKHRDR